MNEQFIEEYNNARRSPLYFYNKYVKPKDDPDMTQEEWDAKQVELRAAKLKRGGSKEQLFILIDDTE